MRRAALIVGAGKRNGMGFATARILAGRGVAVALMDLAAEGGGPHGNIDELIAELGSNAVALFGDVSKEEDVERVVAQAVERFGRLDILVNCAAAPQAGDRNPIEKVSLADWNRQFEIGLAGAFLTCRACAPIMRGQRFGRIINIGSIAGVTASANRAAYTSTKAGLAAMTRNLAIEFAADGITVNIVNPGNIITDRQNLVQSPTLPDIGAEIERRAAFVPAGYLGEPEDVAAVIAFLASDEARYVTAQVINVDGGLGSLLAIR